VRSDLDGDKSGGDSTWSQHTTLREASKSKTKLFQEV
jgi:hypothetical protein